MMSNNAHTLAILGADPRIVLGGCDGNEQMSSAEQPDVKKLKIQEGGAPSLFPTPALTGLSYSHALLVASQVVAIGVTTPVN